MSEELPKSIPINNHEDYFFRTSGWKSLGESAGGRNIYGRRLPKKQKNLKEKKSALKDSSCILLIGGVHGDETEGIQFMAEFAKEFAISKNSSFLKHDIFLIPIFNPDGFLNYKRQNHNRVDLNRNLPTKDWDPHYTKERYYPGKHALSEPENKVLVDIISNYEVKYIISFHSYKPMINVNGPAEEFAKIMEKTLKMPIVDDIGYPTPGSLGTYVGKEREIPTITLEFKRGMELSKIYPYARDAVLESFEIL